MEEFVAINGFEGLYEINKKGEVRSVPSFKRKTIRNIKCQISKSNGEQFYMLTKNGQMYRFTKQELECLVFGGDCCDDCRSKKSRKRRRH